MKKLLTLTAMFLIHFLVFAQKEYKTFHKNGNIKEIGNRTESGYRIGEWKTHYEDGQLESIGNFKDLHTESSPNDNRVGIWKFYFKNGQLRAKGKYDKKG